MTFHIDMPQNVVDIIERLENAGYEAFAVGGCVRDAALGRIPHDWDITTSALPEEVKALFRRTIDTGIKHGTVTIMIQNEGYEVTTYRIDGKYQDHRRPDSVNFTRSLEEDLKRRDFTINAMAYSESKGLVDLFGGISDLHAHIIRCVGKADDRFNEDALRILRAVRFAAQLGFVIDKETQDAARHHAEDLSAVSAERVEAELTKILLSEHPEEIDEAYSLGITKIILPEYDRMAETPQNNPYHIYDVGRHTIEVIRNIPADKVLRYTALFHDSGKPDAKTTDENGIDHFKGHNVLSEEIAKKVCRRLKMDNDTTRDVAKLVYWHDFGLTGGIKKVTLRKAISRMGIEYFDSFIAVRRADMAGQSDYKKDESIEIVNKLIEMKDEIVRDNDALKISDLKIGGADLIGAGVPRGPEMGKILKNLLEYVIENPELNQKEILIEKVKKIIAEK